MTKRIKKNGGKQDDNNNLDNVKKLMFKIKKVAITTITTVKLVIKTIEDINYSGFGIKKARCECEKSIFLNKDYQKID